MWLARARARMCCGAAGAIGAVAFMVQPSPLRVAWLPRRATFLLRFDECAIAMTAEINLRMSRGWPGTSPTQRCFGASPGRSCKAQSSTLRRREWSVNRVLAVRAVEAGISCCGRIGDEMHKSHGCAFEAARFADRATREDKGSNRRRATPRPRPD